MRHLTNSDIRLIHGGDLKTDIGAYTLAVGGLSLTLQGSVTCVLSACTGNVPMAINGAVTTMAGVAMVGSVAYSEYTGTTQLKGWYDFANKVNHYKNFLGL